MNFQIFKLDLENVSKGQKRPEEPEIKLPTSVRSSKKHESSRKMPTFALLTTPKPLTLWITTNCGKFLEIGAPETTLHVSRETYVQVKKQQLEPDMEQQTGSKLGKEYIKAVYYYPTHLTYMQSTSCRMLDEAQTGIKREVSRISDMQIIPSLQQKAKNSTAF